MAVAKLLAAAFLIRSEKSTKRRELRVAPRQLTSTPASHDIGTVVVALHGVAFYGEYLEACRT